MQIIGVSGLAGAGKDQVATYLVEDFGFVRMSLADPLKQICRRVYAFTDEQLWGPSQFRNGPDSRYPRPDGTFLSPREALQTLGTEWGRSCYPDTWAQLCVRTAKELLTEPIARYDQKQGLYYLDELGGTTRGNTMTTKGVVIPDCRFKNEMAAIKAAGGKVVRVTRPGSGLSNERGLHPSETEQASIPDEEFDHVIRNNGTLEDLRFMVKMLMPPIE